MDPLNTQNSSGMMNGMPPSAPHQDKKVGPVVGALIIILILIIAALYFFGQKLNTSTPAQESTQAVQDETLATPAAEADDVASIEADLEAELQDIDYSF